MLRLHAFVMIINQSIRVLLTDPIHPTLEPSRPGRRGLVQVDPAPSPTGLVSTFPRDSTAWWQPCYCGVFFFPLICHLVLHHRMCAEALRHPALTVLIKQNSWMMPYQPHPSDSHAGVRAISSFCWFCYETNKPRINPPNRCFNLVAGAIWQKK